MTDRTTHPAADLRQAREPIGTYTEGYDAGAADASAGRDRQYPRVAVRTMSKWLDGKPTAASEFRFGYHDGYGDYRQRLAR
jgi:hypothetical protein